jgi:hypothetical protein
MRRLLPTSLALLLALGVAAGAHAQETPAKTSADQAVLPVWNNASGKLEAYLVLEPSDVANARVRRRFGMNSLDATFDLEAGDSLALLCDRKNGIAGAIGNLANNCMLATLNDQIDGEASKRASATAAFNRSGNNLGFTLGSGRDNLPGWLTPGAPANNKVDINDLTVFARKSLPGEGYVSIAGTVAKARLLSPAAAEASGLALDRWTSKTLEVGGGFGNFGASIVGHVVDTPGQPKWQGFGLGVTWRTPWSGELTVGADNVITRGKNPFAPVGSDGEDEGTVPYVRYEQDL